MVVCGKRRLVIDFSREQTARERKTHKNPDIAFLRKPEEQVFRSLAEYVEDDLHRGNAGKLGGFDRFFHFFNAHAVMPDFALLLKVVEYSKYFGSIVNFGWRT